MQTNTTKEKLPSSNSSMREYAISFNFNPKEEIEKINDFIKKIDNDSFQKKINNYLPENSLIKQNITNSSNKNKDFIQNNKTNEKNQKISPIKSFNQFDRNVESYKTPKKTEILTNFITEIKNNKPKNGIPRENIGNFNSLPNSAMRTLKTEPNYEIKPHINNNNNKINLINESDQKIINKPIISSSNVLNNEKLSLDFLFSNLKQKLNNTNNNTHNNISSAQLYPNNKYIINNKKTSDFDKFSENLSNNQKLKSEEKKSYSNSPQKPKKTNKKKSDETSNTLNNFKMDLLDLKKTNNHSFSQNNINLFLNPINNESDMLNKKYSMTNNDNESIISDRKLTEQSNISVFNPFNRNSKKVSFFEDQNNLFYKKDNDILFTEPNNEENSINSKQNIIKQIVPNIENQEFHIKSKNNNDEKKKSEIFSIKIQNFEFDPEPNSDQNLDSESYKMIEETPINSKENPNPNFIIEDLQPILKKKLSKLIIDDSQKIISEESPKKIRNNCLTTKNSVYMNNNSNEIRAKSVIKDRENPLIQNAKRRASFLNINDFISTLGRGEIIPKRNSSKSKKDIHVSSKMLESLEKDLSPKMTCSNASIFTYNSEEMAENSEKSDSSKNISPKNADICIKNNEESESSSSHSEQNLPVIFLYNSPQKDHIYYMTKLTTFNRNPQKDNDFSDLYREHFIQSFHAMSMTKDLKDPPPQEIEKRKVTLPIIDSLLGKKTLIFDLDETLIHCNDKPDEPSDVVLSIYFGEQVIEARINIRPYAIEILKELSQYFEIIVFTASHKCYANKVIDYLDPNNEFIHHRLSRENCVVTEGGAFIKDLRIIENRDINNIAIIDNASFSFGFQIHNGIPIIPFYNNKEDNELKELAIYLKTLIDKNIIETNKNTFKLHLYTELDNLVEVIDKMF